MFRRKHCSSEFATVYSKHNSNAGGVIEDRSGGRAVAANHGHGFIRNTPQAYSHFTYEKSQRRLVVCDIQGVEDLFTDPQVKLQSLRVSGMYFFIDDQLVQLIAERFGEKSPATHKNI